MANIIQRAVRRLSRRKAAAVYPRPKTFAEVERQVQSLAGLSWSEIDARLGVAATNRNAARSGYLSPHYYRRIPIETPEQKRKREEKVARFLRRKD